MSENNYVTCTHVHVIRLACGLPEDKIIVSPYQSSNGNQTWVMTESEIQTMDDFEMLVGLENESRDVGAHACCLQTDGSDLMQWTFEHA